MLDSLKEKVDTLLLAHKQLKADNQQLRQEIAYLQKENAALLQKNQQATNSIKRILAEIGKQDSSQ